ncbi:hypothetical protein BH09SUM1_BH09SUM1_02630 [soil metagenome]
MNPTVDSVVALLDRLTDAEKGEVVSRILDRIDFDSGGDGEAEIGQEEVVRRARELREGTEKGIPAREVRRRAAEKLGA